MPDPARTADELHNTAEAIKLCLAWMDGRRIPEGYFLHNLARDAEDWLLRLPLRGRGRCESLSRICTSVGIRSALPVDLQFL